MDTLEREALSLEHNLPFRTQYIYLFMFHIHKASPITFKQAQLSVSAVFQTSVITTQ